MPGLVEPGYTVLFQGDSITDANRDREATQPNNPQGLGRGYALLAAATLLRRMPGVRCFNRGISGNRVSNLTERWDADCLALKPDVVSILIGVNDTWHGTAKGTPENGTDLDRFDTLYRELLDRTLQALPGVSLVICDPFVTEAGAVLEMAFHPDIDRRRDLVIAIAEDYASRCRLAHVRFQSVFDEAIAACSGTAPGNPGNPANAGSPGAEPVYWTHDGVHPTLAGHALMAEAWLDAVASA